MTDKEKFVLTAKEEALIEVIRKVDYGEVRVIINGGVPNRIEEIKKSIKL